jgi:hypothetical protein
MFSPVILARKLRLAEFNVFNYNNSNLKKNQRLNPRTL